jgi:hypothetical protein
MVASDIARQFLVDIEVRRGDRAPGIAGGRLYPCSSFAALWAPSAVRVSSGVLAELCPRVAVRIYEPDGKPRLYRGLESWC